MGEPPLTATFFSSLPDAKPTQRLSGEMNGEYGLLRPRKGTESS